MEKIRFAQFVIDDIAKNGMKATHSYTGNMFYTDVRRPDSVSGCAYPMETKDDWNLFVECFFFFYSVRLLRGKERVKIKLTLAEEKQLVELHKQAQAHMKQAEKNRRIAEDQMKNSMQWWP